MDSVGIQYPIQCLVGFFAAVTEIFLKRIRFGVQIPRWSARYVRRPNLLHQLVAVAPGVESFFGLDLTVFDLVVLRAASLACAAAVIGIVFFSSRRHTIDCVLPCC
jgi:hypothetical protein